MNIYEQKDYWLWIVYILTVIAMVCTFAPFVFDRVDAEVAFQDEMLNKSLIKEQRAEIMKAHGERINK